MSSALTREYPERISESKTSLDEQNLNDRKRDSEDYQSFVIEGFYFGFWFWAKFLAAFPFFLRGFSDCYGVNRQLRGSLFTIFCWLPGQSRHYILALYSKAAGDMNCCWRRLCSISSGVQNKRPTLKKWLSAQLIEGNGYDTRQSSLLYVFVVLFAPDPAQNTIVVYSELRN